MFFIMGITDGEKQLNFVKAMICKCCGSYGRYEAFMTYSVFSLFFIPLLKWNKHYYIKTSCCNTIYEISSDLGRRIEKGESVDITEDDLIMCSSRKIYRRCPKCGFITAQDFAYCPKCSERLI